MPSTVTVKHLVDHQFVDVSLADVARLGAGDGLVWVDVVDPGPKTLGKIVEQVPLPPLVVEDITQGQSRPKIDLYPQLLFFVWIVPRAADPTRPLRTMRYTDVCFVVHKHVVVTTRSEPVKAIDDLLAGQLNVSSPDPAWLVHAILDRSTDELLDTVDSGSERLDALENDVLERADQTQLQTLYAMKRELLELRKVVQGERDVVRELARSEAWIAPEAYMYYEDVGDHLARIADEVDTYFEVATGIMDIYLSSQNNRMNEIMKQLTVVATIFMPLTLLSGIYGMNLVRGMWPQPESAWSFAAVVGAMLVIAAGMLWYFRRRKWW
jgi:magnesium transporter